MRSYYDRTVAALPADQRPGLIVFDWGGVSFASQGLVYDEADQASSPRPPIPRLVGAGESHRTELQRPWSSSPLGSLLSGGFSLLDRSIADPLIYTFGVGGAESRRIARLIGRPRGQEGSGSITRPFAPKPIAAMAAPCPARCFLKQQTFISLRLFAQATLKHLGSTGASERGHGPHRGRCESIPPVRDSYLRFVTGVCRRAPKHPRHKRRQPSPVRGRLRGGYERAHDVCAAGGKSASGCALP
jgi:hypothetical protein